MAKRAPAGAAGGDDDRLIELTRRLAAVAAELGLSEIEVESAGTRLRVQRGGGAGAPVVTAAPVASGPSPVIEPAVVADVAAPTTVTVEAPMVGTFYRASGPTAEPYVREGDVVKQGQIICIIEAMKLMNEIESKAAGRVVKILVENGQPVEYGQPLFVLEPPR
ncbi:MAG TPA: acetyl-CoA carboxylase biotin carboxyl carrier protein [Methylomirabilota bacterium]|jgi:acetyl-CoA carboxylase biotin carboxyl carrier protein|nr:acetyl-CoA carboxylase biotin carboxyl carrier protein [Methylomirabilota bacterium]